LLVVVAVVADVPGSSGRSLKVATIVPESRWKWSRWFQTFTAAAEGR